MPREKPEKLSEDSRSIKELESSRYVARDFQEAVDDGDATLYEWFEDKVIKKEASVKFKKDSLGDETATITLKDPKPNEGNNYYTANRIEVSRLREIMEGRPVKIEIVEDKGSENS